MKLGNKIADRRKEIGLTQVELAEKMMVTRQTVSRWEAGSVLPDIEKITQLAEILQVSCDYLLKDEENRTESEAQMLPEQTAVTRLVAGLVGKKVKFSFYDDDMDEDILEKECVVESLDGCWLKVKVDTKKGTLQKLISISSVLAIDILDTEQEV